MTIIWQKTKNSPQLWGKIIAKQKVFQRIVMYLEVDYSVQYNQACEKDQRKIPVVPQ